MIKIDMHSHILPGMDDGACDEQMSVRMLEMLRDDGVNAVALTPHFYCRNESVDTFLQRRAESFERLQKAIGDRTDLPKLFLGAEVYYSFELEAIDLTKVCYGDSRLMLLELPFERFSKVQYDIFNNFSAHCPVDVTLAHIERYFELNDPDELMDFVSYNGVPAQCSCSSFFEGGFLARRKMLSYAKKGAFALMGTDAHNISSRKPEFGRAEAYLRKHIGNEAVDDMLMLSYNIAECVVID